MKIPKIIHQMAPKNKEDWHPIWDECFLSWRKNFCEGEYKYYLWDDDEINYFIEKNFSNYWNFFKNLPFHIMKLDFARYCILYQYGGIYCDMDMYCYKNFYKDILKKDCYLVESYVEFETVQNSLMASKPKNIFFKTCLIECIKNYSPYEKEINYDNFGDHCKYVLDTTGPKFLSRIYNKFKKSSIGVLPINEYNPELCWYDDNIKTKHMLTGRWGKETISYLKQKHKAEISEMDHNDFLLKDYLNFRNINFQKFNFNEKYININY